MTVLYRGTINEEACYPDIDEQTREQGRRLFLYNIGKRYAFITPAYVLLTPEDLWYPEPGIPRGAAYPEEKIMDFIRFSLRVRTTQGLRAVSQGAVEETHPGEFVFSPEVPLSRLSLAIGPYEARSLSVDSLEYNLYILKGHDYFSKYFTEVLDTLPSLIRTARTQFESRLQLSYPYRRLSLVEVPIQFCAYPRIWTLGTETVQPEQVLLPEKGVTLQAGDFKTFTYFANLRLQRGRGTVTPEEIKRFLFRRFVDRTFLGTATASRGFRALFRRQARPFSLMSLIFLAIPEDASGYSLFPLYYTYVRHFASDKWPVFNTAMEFYLIGRVENEIPAFLRFFTGLSGQELANFALMKQSLAEILANPEHREEIPDVLRLKCAYLFALMQSELEKESFERFLNALRTSKWY